MRVINKGIQIDLMPVAHDAALSCPLCGSHSYSGDPPPPPLVAFIVYGDMETWICTRCIRHRCLTNVIKEAGSQWIEELTAEDWWMVIGSLNEMEAEGRYMEMKGEKDGL